MYIYTYTVLYIYSYSILLHKHPSTNYGTIRKIKGGVCKNLFFKYLVLIRECLKIGFIFVLSRVKE